MASGALAATVVAAAVVVVVVVVVAVAVAPTLVVAAAWVRARWAAVREPRKWVDSCRHVRLHVARSEACARGSHEA
ncbi:MAG: hypothetical protein U0168_23365 [Nannocystaceae bacterium]